MRNALQAAHGGDAHDGRPMYTQEVQWIHPTLQLLQGLAQGIASRARAYAHMISIGLDETDVIERYNHTARADGHQQARGIGRDAGGASADAFGCG